MLYYFGREVEHIEKPLKNQKYDAYCIILHSDYGMLVDSDTD